MSKNIGIVCEGPTDFMLLKGVIDQITGEENTYLQLQPEDNLKGEYGNGWKGVWKWCLDHRAILEKYRRDIFPRLDILIIQMDGDVARKEKEVHCHCVTTVCEWKNIQNPLECVKAKSGGCPVTLPCASHTASVEDYIGHLTERITSWLGQDQDICIVIPCDSTDAWVVAAYEDQSDIELIEDPWKSVISRGKYYHNIRIRGDRKSISVYRQFVADVCGHWEDIKQRCVSARWFEEKLRDVCRTPDSVLE